MTLYEAIFRRRSIRKYREEALDEKLLYKIEHFGQDAICIRPDLRIRWKIWKASEHNVKGMFQVKAPYYVALYSENGEDSLVNAGCLMEQLSLYLHTKGIGSCYQGAAHICRDPEKELELVMIMAFGRPAEPLERSREEFHREELKHLLRVHGSFGKVQRKLLEAARLAPSAMNLQPWKFVVTDNQVHLFVKKPGRIGYRIRQDWNLFDAGIVLSHLLITSEELWFNLECRKLDSVAEKELQNYVYISSLIILDDSARVGRL